MTGDEKLWIAPQKLILASRSASRQALLRSAGIAFDSVPADLDERAIEAGLLAQGASAPEVGLGLARRKAVVVAHKYPGRAVLAADQVLALGANLFSKPPDRAAAARQLAALSGRTHVLHCAMVLLRDEKILWESCTEAAMTMRVLSPAFIDRYLDAAGDGVTASVGAYFVEGLGIHLFDSVAGDQSTIMGLSLLPLLAFLRRQAWVAS